VGPLPWLAETVVSSEARAEPDDAPVGMLLLEAVEPALDLGLVSGVEAARRARDGPGLINEAVVSDRGSRHRSGTWATPEFRVTPRETRLPAFVAPCPAGVWLQRPGELAICRSTRWVNGRTIAIGTSASQKLNSR
jgi:hypothetical protein